MEKKLGPQPPKFLMAIHDPAQLRVWLQTQLQMVGLCMTGRSNVGKSTLINSLMGKGVARVSKTPGRTREVIIFECQILNEADQKLYPYFLLDLPGYGFAKVSRAQSQHWDELLGTLFEYFPPDMRVINIQDARHPDQSIDREFHQFLRPYQLETVLVFNKLDKLKTQKERAELEKAKLSLYKSYKKVKEIYFVSAEKGTGLEELMLGLKTFLLKKAMTRSFP